MLKIWPEGNVFEGDEKVIELVKYNLSRERVSCTAVGNCKSVGLLLSGQSLITIELKTSDSSVA
jgi:hypothetical protein